MNKTFGELNRSEKIKLLTAWIDGEIIERYFDDLETWGLSSSPIWGDNLIYRVKPSLPSIDWEQVHSDFNYLATDMNGRSCLYKREPRLDVRYWTEGYWAEGKYVFYACTLSSFKKGTCDWTESLVVRPKKGE